MYLQEQESPVLSSPFPGRDSPGGPASPRVAGSSSPAAGEDPSPELSLLGMGTRLETAAHLIVRLLRELLALVTCLPELGKSGKLLPGAGGWGGVVWTR